MGRDLNYYPERGSKDALKQFVIREGYSKDSRASFVEWPKGSSGFFWFDNSDYKSITGVELTIFPVAKKDNPYNDNTWAVHVRNTYAASYFDVLKLNQTIRDMRKQFGGDFLSDNGKNRYFDTGEDNSSPLSRGIEQIYTFQRSNLEKIKFALPDEKIKLPQQKDFDSRFDYLTEVIRMQDPSRVIYNGLLPLLVAIIESFLYDYFHILLRYDATAQRRLVDNNQTIKLDLLFAKGLEGGDLKKEEAIAHQFKFQNLNSTQKAFGDYLDIDMNKILHAKIIKKRPRTDLYQAISNIISTRHDVVHGFILDPYLSKQAFSQKISLVQSFLDVITDEVERKHKITIQRDL
jgi:hypothetical protein